MQSLRFSLLGVLILAASANAQDDQIAVTQHQITVDGYTLHYMARAGRLPIRDSATGEVRASIFFVAYTVDSPKLRPLTFAWNGGPGSSSSFVHMIGFGPKHIKGEDDPVNPPAVESELEDNQGTWLEQTDLVFVDPVEPAFPAPQSRIMRLSSTACAATSLASRNSSASTASASKLGNRRCSWRGRVTAHGAPPELRKCWSVAALKLVEWC